MDRKAVTLQAPMLIPLLGFIAGIFLSQLGAGILTGVFLIVAGMTIYEVLIHLNTEPVAAYRVRNIHHLWVLITFAGTGIVVTEFSQPRIPDQNILDRSELLQAHIMDIQSTTAGDVAILRLQALVDSSGTIRTVPPVKLRLSTDVLDADIDDEVLIPSELTPVSGNDSEPTGFHSNLLHKGILYLCRVPGRDIRVTGHRNTINGNIVRLRGSLEEHIEKSGLAIPTQNFLITLLLGDRTYLRPDVRNLFADSGVSHMLALSGMHISIIAGILLWILFPLNFVGKYRWRYGLAVPILWFYTVMTGLNPSTVRAALMTTCVISCMLLERKNSSWNALLLSVFIILLFSPEAIYDIGLQLSFVCVASLIMFAGIFNPVDHHAHPRIYAIYSAILVTLTATASSWVLTSFYFGIFPLSFIPANLIALPLLPAYVILALVYFAMHATGLPSNWLGQILDGGYSSLTHVLQLLNNDGQGVLQFTVPSLTVILWLSALSILAIWLHSHRSRVLLCTSLTCAVAAIAIIPAMGTNRQPDTICFRPGPDTPSFSVSRGNKSSIYQGMTNAITEYNIEGKHIVICDTKALPDTPLQPCHYLFITRSCTASLEELHRSFHPDTIVVHQSISRKKESLMRCQADSMHLRLHSIRLDGPLSVPVGKLRQ